MLSGNPEKGTAVNDTSRNNPHAIVLFRTDPEWHGVEIISATRQALGLKSSKIMHANVAAFYLGNLPSDLAQTMIWNALEQGIHVIVEARAVWRFRRIIEEHRQARMEGNPFYNLIWTYRIKKEGGVSFTEAGQMPQDEVAKEAAEARARARTKTS